MQLALSHFVNSSASRTSIVHIESIAAEPAAIPWLLYNASKSAIVGFVRTLSDLEERHGVGVVCINPGVVKTPLFMDSSKNSNIVDDTQDTWVTAEEVARVMLAAVERDSVSSQLANSSSKGGHDIPIKGGTVLEVLAGAVRAVPRFNNPGPFVGGGKGAAASNSAQISEGVLESLKPGWGLPDIDS